MRRCALGDRTLAGLQALRPPLACTHGVRPQDSELEAARDAARAPTGVASIEAQEVVEMGPSALCKLEERVRQRQTVQDVVMDIMEMVMDRVALRKRKSKQEEKRREWQSRWEALELEMALEMDNMMELELEAMDTQESVTATTYARARIYEEDEMEIAYELENGTGWHRSWTRWGSPGARR